MNSLTGKIIGGIILLIVIVGGIWYWQTSPQDQITAKVSERDGALVPSTMVDSYENDFFSVQFPSNFQRDAEAIGVVTIYSARGKIRIVPASVYTFDASGGPEAPSDPDALPKNIVNHGFDQQVSSALFYTEGDVETRDILKKIQDSVVVK